MHADVVVYGKVCVSNKMRYENYWVVIDDFLIRKIQKYSLFCLFLVIIFWGMMHFFGYAASLVGIVFAIICYKVYFSASKKQLLFFCLLLLPIFDNEFFAFSSFEIRPWYVLVVPLAFFFLLKDMSATYSQRYYLFVFTPLFILISLGLMYSINDGVAGLLYYFKYIIYVALIYCIIRLGTQMQLNNVLLSFWLVALFVALFGIIQFIYNVTGDYRLMFTPDLRPHGFFSETTWYGEFAVFGLLISLALMPKNKLNWIILFSIGIFITGIILSVTRNAFVALGCVIIGYYMFKLFRFLIIRNHRKKQLKHKWLMAIFCFIAIFTVLGSGSITVIDTIFSIFVNKSQLVDDSAQGRILALQKSIALVRENWFVGQGFLSSEALSISGITIGSKSFNLFFMMYHIYGIFGFTIFMLWLTYGFYITVKLPLVSGKYMAFLPSALLIGFLVMSMIAPIHQYAFGMVVVGLVIITLKKQNRYAIQ